MVTAAELTGHVAAFYTDDREYLDMVEPYVRDGLDQGDVVSVTVPPDKLGMLRDALSDVLASVTLSDMADIGRNPARGFAVLGQLHEQHPGRRIRVVAEPIWPGGRSADHYPACVQNEALWNLAFGDSPTLCPYDAGRLPETVLTDARMTHPLIWQGGAAVPSDGYAHDEAFERYNKPLPVDPTAVTYTLRAMPHLSMARMFAADYAETIGMPADRIGDLQLIVSELATNSLKYTSGACRLALWQQEGEGQQNGNLVCHVSDTGRLDDPLAGRRLPSLHATSGRGLFLVNALADLVRIHTGENGTTVQTYLHFAPTLQTAQ